MLIALRAQVAERAGGGHGIVVTAAEKVAMMISMTLATVINMTSRAGWPGGANLASMVSSPAGTKLLT